MEVVAVLGCDGYIGHALTLRLLELGKYKVYGVDDFQRRTNVKEMGSFSATPIQDPTERHRLFTDIGDFDFLNIDISTEADILNDYLSEDPPSIIVNLAQQPSAPYSFKTQEHSVNTTFNNLIGTLNVLYFMKNHAPNAHLVQIGSMGEYDPAAGDFKIPEGTFDLFDAKNVIFPRRPGSWYHASKVASTYYIDAACRWWGLKATDIMQGVVYGNWTPEIEMFESPTRLDSDECFGTVVNRFIVQTLLGEAMTIYGEGMQKRGYLALNDSVQCLILAMQNVPKDGTYRTWNQLDKVYTIHQIADAISQVADFCNLSWDKNTIKSPRAERTDDFYYKPETAKLKELGFAPTRSITDEADYLLKTLKVSELFPLKEVVMPRITWK
jgi:UDP-sulfoquinovose synthase